MHAYLQKKVNKDEFYQFLQNFAAKYFCLAKKQYSISTT